MGAVLPIVGIASMVFGAVGMGMQYYAQQQASQQAAAMAQYNYQMQAQQAQMQMQMMQAQQSANAQLLEFQAGMQQRNADAMRAQAEIVQQNYATAAMSTQRAGVVNVQRDRQDARQFLALQMAKVGSSGMNLAGTPLDAIADAAGTLELRAQERWQETQLEFRRLHDLGETQAYTLRESATNEGMKAGMTLFQAANERWVGETAKVQHRLSMYGAEIERMKGMNNSAGYKMAAYGSLFSGLADLGQQGYGMSKWT